MIHTELYYRLENDFIKDGISDTWVKYMGEVQAYLSKNFKERDMGVVCDFADEISKVYTAVFPSEKVMRQIIDDNATDAMLFVHHAMTWDIRRPNPFIQMNVPLLDKFKEKQISIYCLHSPLDHYSDYSTSRTLADALELETEKPFQEHCGTLCGVIGRTKCKTVEELNAVFSKAVGHPTRLYPYGHTEIENGWVAIVAGGGNDSVVVEDVIKNNVNVLITGITAKTDKFSDVHKIEQENRINVLGGTHYSTEKFACQKMCRYFETLGLESVFIEDEPVYEDM